MPLVIDLNCDLGEGVGDDAALFPLVSSANIACGGHTGDAESMRNSVRLAIRHGVAVGAHPSYVDREGFGRRALDVDPAVLRADIARQIAALIGIADDEGTRVRYVKAHGALYNRAQVDDEVATALVLAVRDVDAGLPLLGMEGSALAEAATAHGSAFFAEAFIDRGYLADGRLAPRSSEGALLTDPAAVIERALGIVRDHRIVAVDSTLLEVRADSLCVHGDTPGAATLAAAVRTALESAGVRIEAFA
ncbi:LamB/YcsF family protein [Agromyces atrinae]|uniref:LamB/YcsF family protein n=1 Tax=Agromyces atrinae TaxID=592376 RepID=UPI001F55FFBB|nr:5-oxoprolinase subunit PxpA [Agromyces atrinae]MCI2957780.1 LamB/YcsF family protein [Agromyces atrinae]